GGARRPDGADELRLAERLPDVTPITEHLSILPAGAARRHAAEVLRLPVLGTVVQQLAHRFDVVVYHTSGRPDYPDALLLAAHVRSAVLLIRAGVDSAEHIRRVKEPLERAGVTLLGFALVGQRV
ncbi:MAG TPA: hypothetical protein VHN78_15515, partial [Chloroflexota bacterium]|nr:hypothetical protein [Chloroflexota bacterium]